MKKLLIILSVILFLFAPDVAMAAEWWTMSKMWSAFLTFTPLLIILFSVIIVSWLLEPVWYSWAIFWIQDSLRDIWILSMNVVYIVFAILLIWLAFMNIVWREGDTYKLKSALPKFIVSVIIVPFTWFFVQFVLSISAVLTASVLILPANMISENSKINIEMPFHDYCVFDLSQNEPVGPSSWNWEEKITFCNSNEDKVNSWESTFLWWAYWIMYYYAFTVFDIENVGVSDLLEDLSLGLTTDDQSIMQSLNDLWVEWFNLLLNIVLVIAYLLLMLWLVIVLFVRVIRIWLYTMFSPLFVLSYYTWSASKNKLFSAVEFVKIAFVPVLVAWALAFWAMFSMVITAGLWNSFVADGEPWAVCDEKEYFSSWVGWWDPASGGLSSVWERELSENDYIICINGKPAFVAAWLLKGNNPTGQDGWPKSATAMENNPTSKYKVWVLWIIILRIFALVIVWMSFMAAVKYSEITASVIAPIEKIWTNTASFAKALPMNTPFLPWGQSLKSLSILSWKPTEALKARSAQVNRDSGLGSAFGWKGKDGQFNDNKASEIRVALNDSTRDLNKSSMENYSAGLYGLINQAGSITDDRVKDIVKLMAERLEDAISKWTLTKTELQSYWINKTKDFDKEDIAMLLAGWNEMHAKKLLSWVSQVPSHLRKFRFWEWFTPETAADKAKVTPWSVTFKNDWDRRRVRVVNDAHEVTDMNVTENMIGKGDFGDMIKSMKDEDRRSLKVWLSAATNSNRKIEVFKQLHKMANQKDISNKDLAKALKDPDISSALSWSLTDKDLEAMIKILEK